MLYDYQRARELSLGDEPFYALIMAAMWRADSDNLAKLKAAWPDVWDELHARYHSPGARLADEVRFERDLATGTPDEPDYLERLPRLP